MDFNEVINGPPEPPTPTSSAPAKAPRSNEPFIETVLAWARARQPALLPQVEEVCRRAESDAVCATVVKFLALGFACGYETGHAACTAQVGQILDEGVKRAAARIANERGER